MNHEITTRYGVLNSSIKTPIRKIGDRWKLTASRALNGTGSKFCSVLGSDLMKYGKLVWKKIEPAANHPPLSGDFRRGDIEVPGWYYSRRSILPTSASYLLADGSVHLSPRVSKFLGHIGGTKGLQVPVELFSDDPR